ncbi:hypothetical protein LZS97_19460, partial [Vibrio fluvialis]|uniref:hypothetical protein n=1 Tax=Vibrio fluvialis TaxID=676 RepID=UPI001F468544
FALLSSRLCLAEIDFAPLIWHCSGWLQTGVLQNLVFEGLRKIVCVSGPKVVTPWCGVSEWLGDSKDIKKPMLGIGLSECLILRESV